MRAPLQHKPASRRSYSFRRRVAVTLIGVIALFTLIVFCGAALIMIRSLRAQFDKRAMMIAANLSDAAAGPLLKRNSLELHALVSKYALLQDVAYAFVQDARRNVIAHNLGAFPSDLRESLRGGVRGRPDRRTLRFGEKSVYEARFPILEGQAGSAHVGIYEDARIAEIRKSLVPLIGGAAGMLVAGVLFSLIVSRRLSRPLLRLAHMAENMSKGDLETPISVESQDEMGDLARSLERMRASLKAAMVRLSSGKTVHHGMKEGARLQERSV